METPSVSPSSPLLSAAEWQFGRVRQETGNSWSGRGESGIEGGGRAVGGGGGEDEGGAVGGGRPETSS